MSRMNNIGILLQFDAQLLNALNSIKDPSHRRQKSQEGPEQER